MATKHAFLPWNPGNEMSAEVDKAYERLQRCTIDDCNMILTWTSLEPVLTKVLTREEELLTLTLKEEGSHK